MSNSRTDAKSRRKLAVRRETIKTLAALSDVDLAQVVGGGTRKSGYCWDPQSGNSRLC